MLGSSINHDKIDCIKFLLNSGLDLSKLKGNQDYRENYRDSQ